MTYVTRKIRYLISKDSPMIHILSWMNPIRRIDTYFFMVNFKLYSYLRLCLPKGLFLVGLPVNILKALLLSEILSR